MRRRTWPLVVAALLMLAGLAGIVAGAAVLRSTPTLSGGGSGGATGGRSPDGRQQFGGFGSNGERVYYTGVGHNGAISRRWDPPRGFGGGMMGRRGGRDRFAGMGCVTCHRSDGRGGRIGMMGTTLDAPDIRYEALASPREETSGTVAGWTEVQIAEAIRDGIEPDGERLDPFMPRWDMDTVDMKDTIDYLKELSKR